MIRGSRLFFLIILMEIALLAYGDIVIRKLVFDRTTATINQQQLVTVKYAAASLQAEINNVTDKLHLIALLDEVTTGNTSACLRKLTASLPNMADKTRSLSRLNNRMVINCSTAENITGLSRSDQEHVQKIFTDPEHKATISRAVDSPAYAKKVIAIVVPIFTGNQNFQGALVGAIALETLYNQYLPLSFSPQKSSLVILDDNGDIISHQDKTLIGKNIDTGLLASHKTILNKAKTKASDLITYRENGNDMIAAYAVAQISPDRKWVVIFRSPADAIYSQLVKPGAIQGLWTVIQANLVIAFAILFTTGVVAFFVTVQLFSRRLIEKISR